MNNPTLKLFLFQAAPPRNERVQVLAVDEPTAGEICARRHGRGWYSVTSAPAQAFDLVDTSGNVRGQIVLSHGEAEQMRHAMAVGASIRDGGSARNAWTLRPVVLPDVPHGGDDEATDRERLRDLMRGPATPDAAREAIALMQQAADDAASAPRGTVSSGPTTRRRRRPRACRPGAGAAGTRESEPTRGGRSGPAPLHGKADMMSATKCTACGRPLSDTTSVQHGMGPVCWAKFQAKKAGADDKGGDPRTVASLPFDPESGDVVCQRGGNGQRQGNELWDVTQTNITQVVVCHSPTGFEWGYAGSGPADFALNILHHFAVSEFGQTPDLQVGTKGDRCSLFAFEFHQDFKREFVAALPEAGGTIPGHQIREWINARLPDWQKNRADEAAELAGV